MYFRPFFWLTFFSLPALAILLMLGFWQLDRLAWKTALIETFNQRATAPSIVPPQPGTDLTELEFHSLKMDGQFLHDKEIYLTGRTYEGNAGFHVVTPFKTEAGQVILVNRGWVSEQYREPESRPFSVNDAPQSIQAILRLPQKKGYFVPDNEPKKGFWFTLRPDEIASHLSISEMMTEYYADAVRQGEVLTLPIAATTNIAVRNTHLNYALTWFGIALSLIGVYIAFHINAGRMGLK